MLEAMQERQVSAGGQDAHAARAVLRAGDAKSAGAGRHVSAARSAARSVPACTSSVDYPSAAEEWEIARRVTTGQLGEIQAVIAWRRNHRDAAAGNARAGQRPGAGLCLGTGAGDAARHAGSAGVRQQMGQLGRGPARRVDAGHLPPRPGRFSTADITRRRPTCKPWPNRPCGTASPATTPLRPTASTARS